MYRYLEQVIPRKHGARRSVFFPIQSLFGAANKSKSNKVTPSDTIPLLSKTPAINNGKYGSVKGDVGVEAERNAVLIDTIPPNSKLVIRDLTKSYAKGDAVSHLYLHVEV